MPFPRRRFGSTSKPSAVDGPKARRRARIMLLNARDLLEPESLARCCGLKVPTAVKLVDEERARRTAG